MRKDFLLPLLLALLLNGISHAATNVSGSITTDTTWTLADSPYVATSGMQVFPGVTLTIEPGVTIRFNIGMGLRIGGELIAEGTATKGITFTSNADNPDKGDWGPIHFIQGAQGSNIDENREYVSGSIIKYCEIEYGSELQSELGVPLYVTDNTIIHNSSRGIYINAGNSIIERNRIIDSDSYGIQATGGDSIVLGNTVIANRSVEGIVIDRSNNTVAGNAVAHNDSGFGSIGISIWGGANNTITGNTITGDSSVGIEVYGSEVCTITGNNLLNNGDYKIKAWNPSPIDIDATDNWWNTTDIMEIEASIYDYYDDLTLRKVVYEPIAVAPFPMPELPPTAVFTATPRSGNVPLAVQFTDQSTGSPTSWLWNFGTEIATSEQNPTHTFNYPGSFTVSLTVSNQYGSDTETKTDYITVQSCGDYNGDGVVNIHDVFDKREDLTQDFRTWIQECWLAERRGSADMEIAEELMREFRD